MGTIKIDVNVNVNLSDDVKTFITSLFASGEQHPPVSQFACDNYDPTQDCFAPVEEQKPIEEQKPVEEQKPIEEQKPVEEQKPAEEQKPKIVIDIELLRRELALKVNEHRPAIKAKLTELGAPSITKLDTAKYQDMYNFLKAL